ncbi:hypothetical protein KCP71_00975 [Salmonella enterica subsp. enterica]|nr:hypothetical protein KCP71_00975 [Salmonella enterica subsp. enterica]
MLSTTVETEISLEHRGLKDTHSKQAVRLPRRRRMDEPESKGAITIATREKLDNTVLCYQL